MCLLYFLAFGQKHYVKIYTFSQHIQRPKTLDTRYKLYAPPQQRSRDRRMRNQEQLFKMYGKLTAFKLLCCYFYQKITRNCIKAAAKVCWNTCEATDCLSIQAWMSPDLGLTSGPAYHDLGPRNGLCSFQSINQYSY